jgi:hypothetical protein
MGVCGFCGERLRLVDYFGLHLCGCVNCNTWEHNGVPAAMAPEDCSALRDQSPQQRNEEAGENLATASRNIRRRAYYD